MTSFNQVIFLGNTGTDPELRTAEDRNSFAKFRLAVTTDFKDKDAQPMWLTVITFGKLAIQVSDLVKKGRLVLVSGRLAIREYTDKQNIQRQAVEVIAQNVQVLPTHQAKAEQEVTTAQEASN